MSHRHRFSQLGTARHAGISLALVTVLAVPLLTATPAQAATDTLAADFGQTTGAFRGGANGTLYGLSDHGVPSQAVLDGAHVTNTSQKPPQGAQHPNGDALDVESSFFAGAGKDMYIYVQDEYPDWAYNGGVRPGDANRDGVWDYLPIVRAAAEAVATKSAHPKDYVFVPFNEPDAGNWYSDWSTMKTQFLADWSAAYTTIQSVYAAHGLGHARIGGPGDARWQQDRTTDLLSYAKANSQLPDVVIWHELGTTNMATFSAHAAQYRAVLATLGLPNIPVNITEYGMLRDMGVPGQLIQWFSAFETAKVDAQTAYWNYAGNIDDNSSRGNGGNGGWWLFKWYGDLMGSSTAKLTPPQPNVADTLQGIAAIDTANRKATVLFGGGSSDVAVKVSGLSPRVFGTSVNVVVRADRLNGAEGASLQPPVILSTRATVSHGALSITVPNADRYSAYQLEVTPAVGARLAVATDLVSSVEAENTALSAATAYFQDPASAWTFSASNSYDVGSFNRAGSSATWSVTTPETGSYRLSILAGANQAPGQHALFVDGVFNQLIKYSADLGWTYRGTTAVTLPLTAGSHILSIRASRDGTTVLPGADITLDRFDLYDITHGESAIYPAIDARLGGGAQLDYGSGSASSAPVGGHRTATFFIATENTGYYDLTADYATMSRSAVTITVNGTPVATSPATAGGNWATTARVFLAQGISEVTVTSTRGALLSDIRTTRGAAQEAADRNVTLVNKAEAEDLTLAGGAAAQTIAPSVGSNGSADASGGVSYVGWLGNSPVSTMTMTRPSGFAAGNYVLVVGAANAERDNGINYNPQVVTRFLDITEMGGATTRAAFRHNYSWNSFWDTSIPLKLATASGSLVIGNATAWGPNVDTVTLAKLVAGSPTTVRGEGHG